MKRRPIRLGFIGCGAHMQFAHLPQVMADQRVELVAVADPQSSQIQMLLQRLGSSRPSYADYREMIRREDLDAVFVSTPHAMHYEQVRFALNHSLHVLVQKPLTIQTDHAAKLIALAERKARFLMVGYQRFFQKASLVARELVAQGKIGEIRGVSCCITQNWENVKGWRADPALAGGGFFMDTGSHLVSAMLWITGLKPVEIRAAFETYGKPVDISGIVSIRFSNGAMGSLSFFGCSKRYDERMSIHGSEGYLDLHNSHSRPHPLHLNEEPVAIAAGRNSASPDSVFIGWIQSGGKGYEPPRIALETIRFSEAAYKSAREGKPVRLRA